MADSRAAPTQYSIQAAARVGSTAGCRQRPWLSARRALGLCAYVQGAVPPASSQDCAWRVEWHSVQAPPPVCRRVLTLYGLLCVRAVACVQVVENAVAAVKHLRSLGCNDIEFSPEDAGR